VSDEAATVRCQSCHLPDARLCGHNPSRSHLRNGRSTTKWLWRFATTISPLGSLRKFLDRCKHSQRLIFANWRPEMENNTLLRRAGLSISAVIAILIFSSCANKSKTSETKSKQAERTLPIQNVRCFRCRECGGRCNGFGPACPIKTTRGRCSFV
jgi:hypothetical protein